MNNFTTVFLFTDIGKFQNFLIFGGGALYIIVFGFLWTRVVIRFRKRPKNKPLSDSAIRHVFQLVTTMVCLPIFGLVPFRTFYYISFYDEYSKLVTRYDAEEYQIAEGVVHVLHIQKPLGHDQGDIVKIDDIEFEVNVNAGGWNYDKTISNGGALTEGTYARIYYVDNPIGNALKYLILRIDVRE